MHKMIKRVDTEPPSTSSPIDSLVSEFYDADIFPSKGRASIVVSRETKILIDAISRNQKTSLSTTTKVLLVDGLNTLGDLVEEVNISKEIQEAARRNEPVPWDKAEKLLAKNVKLEPHPRLHDLLRFIRSGRPGSRDVIHVERGYHTRIKIWSEYLNFGIVDMTAAILRLGLMAHIRQRDERARLQRIERGKSRLHPSSETT